MPSRTIQREGTAREAAVSRIGQRREVVIPKTIFDELHLAEGDSVVVLGVQKLDAGQKVRVVSAIGS